MLGFKIFEMTPINQFSIAFFVIVMIFIVIYEGMDMD